jgi:hypothetical protein
MLRQMRPEQYVPVYSGKQGIVHGAFPAIESARVAPTNGIVGSFIGIGGCQKTDNWGMP